MKVEAKIRVAGTRDELLPGARSFFDGVPERRPVQDAAKLRPSESREGRHYGERMRRVDSLDEDRHTGADGERVRLADMESERLRDRHEHAIAVVVGNGSSSSSLLAWRARE